jgi:hypothetical protein
MDTARLLSRAILTSVESLSAEDPSMIRVDTFFLLCHHPFTYSIAQVVHGMSARLCDTVQDFSKECLLRKSGFHGPVPHYTEKTGPLSFL